MNSIIVGRSVNKMLLWGKLGTGSTGTLSTIGVILVSVKLYQDTKS